MMGLNERGIIFLSTLGNFEDLRAIPRALSPENCYTLREQSARRELSHSSMAWDEQIQYPLSIQQLGYLQKFIEGQIEREKALSDFVGLNCSMSS